MALTLEINEASAVVISSGDLTDPLSFTFDGISGGTKELNLLLTNTGSSDVTIDTIARLDPSSEIGVDSSITSVQFKESSGSYANSIAPDQIVAQDNDFGFWIKIIVPTGNTVKSISDIGIKVDYT